MLFLRYLQQADQAVRNGGTSAGLCGREIRGKKVGIIGCGQIGFMTAKLFQAFGAEVYAYARHESCLLYTSATAALLLSVCPRSPSLRSISEGTAP